MILDVGCGDDPKGDVNCDLYVKDVDDHRNLGNNCLHLKGVPNFVLCSALHLPFKSRVFSDVVCRQVIEHVEEPFALFRELCRVCAVRLVVETVHRLGEACHVSRKDRRWFRLHHVSKFNRRWFLVAAGRVGFSVVRWYNLSYAGFPHDFFAVVRFPYEFGLVLRRD